MKKWFVLVIFALYLQIISPGAMAIFGQDSQEEFEIKKGVETFLGYLVLRDIDAMMNMISNKYYGRDKEGNVIGREGFKVEHEKYLDYISGQYADYEIYNINTSIARFINDEATLIVEYEWKGFNLNTLKEEKGKRRSEVLSVKEEGAWKMSSWTLLSWG